MISIFLSVTTMRVNPRFRRSFLGQFTDPKSVDLIFKRRYDELNEAWSDLFGWPLFRSPE